MKSTLVKNQTKTFGPITYIEDGKTYRIEATLRYDDQCGNGHNSFSITGETHRQIKNSGWHEDTCGSIHEEIEKRFPELKPFIKWHLMSSDGPLYYIENTQYHARETPSEGKEPDLKAARNCAIWPGATLEQLLDTKALNARLPQLIKDFRADMLALGMEF